MNRIILSVLLVVGFCDLFGRDIYVGGAGASDNNPGTATQPYATIQKAASVAVAGDIVKIRAGHYRETIVPANSGTAGSPIIYQPDNGATVVVNGTNLVTTPWTIHSGNIYKTSVSLPVNGHQQTLTSNTTILSNQVFKDDVMQFEARWPKISNVGDLFDISKTRHVSKTAGFNATNITDNGLPSVPGGLTGGKIWVNGWFMSQTKTITSHSGSTINFGSVGDNYRFRKYYYVTGKLGLLTQEKEWHYENGTLYFWQPGGGTPTGVSYKARNWGFDLRGKSNITVEGLQFFGCEPVTGDVNSANITVDRIRAKYLNHVVMQEGSDVIYYNARQTGMKLVGPNSVIKNSEIQYSASQAIWIGERGVVENNLITDISYEGNYGAAVTFWERAGNQVIKNNTIYRTGRSAIDFGYIHHGQHLNIRIEYNDIHHFGMLNIDLGAIYGARYTDLTGTRIHHNWIHDSGVVPDPTGIPLDGIHTGTYFDQAAGPATIDHNVYWNNHHNLTQDAADHYTQPNFESRNAGPSLLYNNTFASSAPKSYVTYVTSPLDVQRNNIYRRGININWGAAGNVANCVLEATNPLFLGTGQGGLAYRLNTGSPAINIGVIIQGITDGSIGVPDAGAYEYGGTAWTAGYTPVATVTPTNTPPVGSITAPTNNSSFTQGTSITVNASASDADGSVTKVEFFDGTTKLGEDTVSPYSYVWSNATSGTHTLTVKITDNANSVTTSAAVTITVSGNVAPVVSLSSPANNAQFQSGTSVTISATASDNDGTISKVEFFNGTTKLGEDLTSPYSFVWNSVAAGTYNLTAKATDNLNSVTTSSSVQIVVSTNTPPTVAITSPANNAKFAPGAPITISATANDTNGSIAKVEFFNGTTKLGEDLTSPYTFVWSNAVIGTHTLTARATDNQNSATTSSPVQVRVSTNTPPSASIKSPKSNSQFRTTDAINIEAEALDANGSIVKVEFFSGATKLGEDLTSPYTFIWNEPTTGTTSLTVKATDNENSVTTSTPVSIVVIGSNSPPSLSITGPSADAQFAPGDSIVIAADATDPDGSVTKVEFFEGTTKIGEDLTAPYTFTWSTLLEGSYELHAVATDNQNGVTTSSIVSISIAALGNIVEENPEDLYSAIPRVFTPNGDGDKDLWIWEGVERFENSLLTVYNRSGQQIYEAYSYNNTWDGTMNGQPLQSGDYYYVVVLEDSTRLQAAFRIYR